MSNGEISEKHSKKVLSYDFYEIVKDRNLRFSMADTYKTKMLSKNIWR